MRRVVIAVAVMTIIGSAAQAARAAHYQTAPGTPQGAGTVTFKNTGGAMGHHVFTVSTVTADCATASFPNAVAVASGDVAMTLQPTFSTCGVAGFGGTVTCGRWKYSLSPSVSLELLQGPSPVPTGYSCRIAAATSCKIDLPIQTVSGIAYYNLNSSGVTAPDAFANGLRIAVDTVGGGVQFRATGCGGLGLPDSTGAYARYTGKSEQYGSGTTPRLWIVTP